MSILQQIHIAILSEIKAQKRSRRVLWLIIDRIEVLDEKPGQIIYRLSLAEPIRVAADTNLLIKVPGREQPIEVQVLFVTEELLVVLSPQPLPQQMGMIRVEFDPTFILKKLDEHLDQVLRFPPAPLQNILEKAIPEPDRCGDSRFEALVAKDGGESNALQRQSIVRMLADKIHLLWGPPGTGKTSTIGVAIAEHIRLGKTCLLLSTSNAAVDEMVKAASCALGTVAYEKIFRTGVSLDSLVTPFTRAGHVERREPSVAKQAQHAELRLKQLTLGLGSDLSSDRKVFDEVQLCKQMLGTFSSLTKLMSEAALSETQCVAATLATLVLSPILSEREFDVVYIDEASMISLPFAFAGAAQASEQVIVAGDFQQLPPICHSDDPDVKRWFGNNLFDYLGVNRRIKDGSLPAYVSMLREQYRMTERIADVVSGLSYGGKLVTSEGIGVGSRPVFIDVSELCPSSFVSVQEDRSYYQPHSLLILNAICSQFGDWIGPENLLLSPFRAQRALLDAAAKDLARPNRTFSRLLKNDD